MSLLHTAVTNRGTHVQPGIVAETDSHGADMHVADANATDMHVAARFSA